jgi:hypothetical protein
MISRRFAAPPVARGCHQGVFMFSRPMNDTHTDYLESQHRSKVQTPEDSVGGRKRGECGRGAAVCASGGRGSVPVKRCTDSLLYVTLFMSRLLAMYTTYHTTGGRPPCVACPLSTITTAKTARAIAARKSNPLRRTHCGERPIP